ncbi:DUF1295 domain-containing protein [Congregibacter sp.]|nr:DUF1295 domain-containing protein [Congregibacter sp.]MDA8961754.1 DUF1295 domain-containing protein [Congregibacter sp.]
MFDLLMFNFLLLMACMLALWLLSIALGDVSFIDSFWAIGFVVVAVASFAYLGMQETLHSHVLLLITAVWGLRLGVFLFLRWRRDGADPRYVRMVEKASGNPHLFTLKSVFLVQGVMLWVVSLPVQLGIFYDSGFSLQALAFAGIAVAALGILFESIGDHQMTAFRAKPDNKGRVMDRGLWRYTRHPNYFGDACVWWGLFLIALDAGAPWWAAVGPALLNWTLVRWSGAALLERRMKRSRPGYEDYIARTSSFIPLPPRARS